MSCSRLVRGVSALAIGVYLATTPVTVDLDLGDGTVRLASTTAFAKDRREDRGDRSDRDDRGERSGKSRSGDRDGEDNDRGSKSDRGGNDHNDRNDDADNDRSHSGSRNASRDESRSGRGGDDDEHDDSRGGRGGGDDSRDDDRRGRGWGSDDGPAGRAAMAAGTGSLSRGLHVVMAEESSQGLEIVYSNGIREEIGGGRYELKNAAGRTVIERTATSADLARIESNVRNSGVSRPRGAVAAARQAPRAPSESQVRRVEVGDRSIEVSYSTGWREQVAGGRYELKDPNNNTVVERRAKQADVNRLMALTR